MAKQSAQGTQEESRKRDAMQIIKHGTVYSLHSCSCLSTAEE